MIHGNKDVVLRMHAAGKHDLDFIIKLWLTTVIGHCGNSHLLKFTSSALPIDTLKCILTSTSVKLIGQKGA